MKVVTNKNVYGKTEVVFKMTWVRKKKKKKKNKQKKKKKKNQNIRVRNELETIVKINENVSIDHIYINCWFPAY